VPGRGVSLAVPDRHPKHIAAAAFIVRDAFRFAAGFARGADCAALTAVGGV